MRKALPLMIPLLSAPAKTSAQAALGRTGAAFDALALDIYSC